MRLKDKVAIVTGGGQGIGQGIALMFAREGARLAIAQRTEAKLEETREQIEAMGGEVLALPIDVGREEEVKRLIDATQERYGGLDILVNNAGIGHTAPVDETDMVDYDRVLDTNLKGMYLGCHYGVPLMKERGKGSIINISSVRGVDGAPRNAVYAATKGGIIGCTRALAAELAPFYIRANTISPGAIKVRDRMAWLLSRIKEEFHEEFRERFGDRVTQGTRFYQPLEITGLPEDVAYCAVYLASDESRFLTGQNIVVDGGLTTYLGGFASERANEMDAGPSREEIMRWVKEHAKDEDFTWG